MKIKLLIVVSALLMSMGAEAKLAGKNVVLVHGFRSQDLSEIPDIAKQRENAKDYWSAFWAQRAEVNMHWSSADRVNGRIKDTIRSQFVELQANGKCAQGCVFVTHSTGDLVLRHALTRFNQWGIDKNRVKVMAVIDLAGAGGGTGIADLAVSVAATRGPITGVIRTIAGAVLKVNFVPERLGVLNDLRVANARGIAQQNNVYPRLRVAGAGDAFARITKGFIRGYDDSVVGMHSACGSRYAGDVKSCSNRINSSGVLRRVSGPGPLLHNHFPILMADRADHEELRNDKRAGSTATSVLNNQTFGGVRVDFQTRDARRAWAGFRKVREIKNSSRKSISATIYDTLNN